MKERFVVVGGTGFIGEYLARALAGEDAVSIGKEAGYGAIERELAPDSVLAILAPSSTEALDTSVVREIVRIAGTKRPRHILYTSSYAVYARSESPRGEDDSTEEKTVYQKNKLAEERLLRDFHGQTGIPVTIARPANVYGDVKNTGIIGRFMRSVLNGSEVVVGESVRDFIFVDDVAQGLLALLQTADLQGVGVFNVATGVGHSIAEVADLIAVITGKKPRVSYDAARTELPLIGNPAKLMELGWKPQYDLERGLRQTYRNFLAKQGK